MKVSKTGFINLIRCNRFAALSQIYHNKEDSIVYFSDSLEEIMANENKERKQVLLDMMFDRDNYEDIDLIYPKDLELEEMNKYYDKVEELAARVIKNKFEGKLIFNTDTKQQKRFSFKKYGYEFYAFIDSYLENKDFDAIFEIKATTLSKFLKLKVNDQPIFAKNNDGIYQLKSELGYSLIVFEGKGMDLFNSYSEVGPYIYDLAFQRLVIENSNKPNKPVKYFLAVLNREYVFDGTYDNDGNPVYDDDIISLIDLTKTTEKYLPTLYKDLDLVINRLDNMDGKPVDLGKFCQKGKTRECPFVSICFDKLPPKNNILQYMYNSYGFNGGKIKRPIYDLINKGYLKMLDLEKEWLERPNNLIQYEVAKSGKPYYNKKKITEGINQLKYPIYHLDFESFPCPLPRYKGERAYDQSLFQFSIHVEHQPGVCDKEKDHYSFLATNHEDQREELVKELIKHIKNDGGSVAVYNISFEKTRIKELAIMFPKYKKELNNISNRLFDIMHILKGNEKLYTNLEYPTKEAKTINYYNEKLEGSFSIKKVLPIFSKLSYNNLNIQNGTQAYITYAKFPNFNKEDYNKNYQSLIEYCKQDTWAMVEILKELRKI